jgi:2-amino-4-hydroxy-6-hydroxymethyldihydropteridine diphosphokinase
LKTVYLSLGSNIGDREGHLRSALEQLNAGGVRVLRVSPVYETEPVDVTGQGWFLNLVVEAGTDLFPLQLLARSMRIERDLGRVRTTPQGPRTIDIDILLYGSSRVKTAELEIPHPRMAERRFVLEPLADLAPDLRHPITGKSVREMLDAVAHQVARRLPPE